MTRLTIGLVAATLFAGTAVGSSPAAWAQMNQRVNRACIAMSGLPRPQVLATTISFSDAIGTEVRMIRGADRRGRMKRLLCGYNRRTGRAEVQEASGWFAATTKP